MSRPAANITLVFILIAYLALGTAYALQTPAWQAPDEPAHYNYIQFIAEKHALPILRKGEYDQAYLEEFTRTPQNIASLSIDPLRYEDYAPPLYYLLAAPIYALTGGWITAIRLFSVVLGGALVVVAYLIGAEAYPDQLPFALGGAAFVAFVPQHLAMMSAVNNDSLSELLIALVVLQSMRLFRSAPISKRKLILLGVTLGPGLADQSDLLLHRRADCLSRAHPLRAPSRTYAVRRCVVRQSFVLAAAADRRDLVAAQPHRVWRPRRDGAGAAQRRRRRPADHGAVADRLRRGRPAAALLHHHVSIVLGAIRLDVHADARSGISAAGRVVHRRVDRLDLVADRQGAGGQEAGGRHEKPLHLATGGYS